MIEVISPVPLMTVQDLGRTDLYRYGICRSGAMDRLALTVGNLLLGNEPGAAALEIPLTPVKFVFRRDVNFSLTGADCKAMLNGRPVPPWWAMPAKAGETLHLAAPRIGARAYLGLAGGIDVADILGSRSTQLREQFGGFDGRAVTRGDVLGAIGNDAKLPPGGLGALPPNHTLAISNGDEIVLRVLPAAEHDHFSAASQEEFWSAGWDITVQSNRAGYRLTGPALQLASALELRSHGVVPGVIQVPAGGQPIIQLADAATMGGYPKIGTVIEADLWRVGQARPGDRLRFTRVDYQQALDAQKAVSDFVSHLADHAARLRSASHSWDMA